ncbi:hypothetical protein Bca4012_051718 [Brassica carinata]|uniref:RNase H type-1 domain-containing protein n=1 Tax=Brassica carinata TaxID=52824 RepID=A0A8X7R7I7_BRACI|nr:hypothetical protein Bca52824_054262 [Brassica carinata]
MADFTWNLLHPTSLLAFIFPGKWQKPPSSFVKCNVGSSWDESSKIGGGACIVRDEKGWFCSTAGLFLKLNLPPKLTW